MRPPLYPPTRVPIKGEARIKVGHKHGYKQHNLSSRTSGRRGDDGRGPGHGGTHRRGKAMPESEIVSWDYEADAVICGCSTGGSAAAVEAHDQGAEALVIEKKGLAGWLDAPLWRCLWAGTKVQAALGVEDDPESFYQYWLATTNGLCGQGPVKKFCCGSAPVVDWLIDDLDGQPINQWEMNGGDDGSGSQSQHRRGARAHEELRHHSCCTLPLVHREPRRRVHQ